MFPVVGSEQVCLLVAAVWGTEAEQLMGRACEDEAVTLPAFWKHVSGEKCARVFYVMSLFLP